MTITRHGVSASMTLPAFYAPVSPYPLFADGFQGGISSWGRTTVSTDPLTNPYNTATARNELRVTYVWDGASPLHYGGASRGVATVVGKYYRVVATVWSPSVGATARAYGTGVIVPPSADVPLTPYPTQVVGTFQATSTTTTIGLTVLHPTAAVANWQDVAVYELVETTTLPLAVESASITLDESWSPFVRASLTCSLPDVAALRLIDPRQAQRVNLSLSQTDTDSKKVSHVTATWPAGTAATFTTLFSGQTVATATNLWGDAYNPTTDVALTQVRPMSLMLRTREVDYVAGTMTLDLTSDEMALQDLARYDVYSTDQLPPPNTLSLRTLVRWGLSLIGADLAPEPFYDAVIDPVAVIWNVGESLWSFLDAYIRTSSLRLYCDETRTWFLEPPVTGATGTLPLSSITELRDTLSREDPAYGDSAVVTYKWVDSGGLQHSVSHFTYTTGSVNPKTVSQEFNVPDPVSPNFAAASLRTRAMTRGRDVRIEAVSDYRADPGQTVVISTPVTSITGSMVSAVTWRFPEDRMDISTRDAT